VNDQEPKPHHLLDIILERIEEIAKSQVCHKRKKAGFATCAKFLILPMRPTRLERAAFWFAAR
jgi:hypothetical protein